MKVEMNENGGINITDVTLDQVGLLAKALKESSNQEFMNDHELSKMFKLMAVMQSDVFEDLKSGKIDIKQFKAN